MTKSRAPYGTWSSPITAEAITFKVYPLYDMQTNVADNLTQLPQAIGLDNVVVDPQTSAVYHVEKRPSEEGRNFLVNTRTGKDVIDKTTGSWNVRSAVHEYGGGAAAAGGGYVYFSNFSDGRIYRVKEGEIPEAVTPGKLRASSSAPCPQMFSRESSL